MLNQPAMTCCLLSLPLPAGLRTLNLSGNLLEELPPALLQATALTELILDRNVELGPQQEAVWEMLTALPQLQRLSLAGTAIGCQVSIAALQAAAAQRGVTVRLQ